MRPHPLVLLTALLSACQSATRTFHFFPEPDGPNVACFPPRETESSSRVTVLNTTTASITPFHLPALADTLFWENHNLYAQYTVPLRPGPTRFYDGVTNFTTGTYQLHLDSGKVTRAYLPGHFGFPIGNGISQPLTAGCTLRINVPPHTQPEASPQNLVPVTSYEVLDDDATLIASIPADSLPDAFRTAPSARSHLDAQLSSNHRLLFLGIHNAFGGGAFGPDSIRPYYAPGWLLLDLPAAKVLLTSNNEPDSTLIYPPLLKNDGIYSIDEYVADHVHHHSLLRRTPLDEIGFLRPLPDRILAATATGDGQYFLLALPDKKRNALLVPATTQADPAISLHIP